MQQARVALEGILIGTRVEESLAQLVISLKPLNDAHKLSFYRSLPSKFGLSDLMGY